MEDSKDGISIIERRIGSIKPPGWALIIKRVVDSFLSHVRSENGGFRSESLPRE